MAKIKELEVELIEDDKEVILMQKINCLAMLLEINVIDDEKNGVFGSDPIYQNAFNHAERKMIKAKIFDFINEI